MSLDSLDSSDTPPPRERRLGCLFYLLTFLLVFGLGLTVAFRAWQTSASKELQGEIDGIRKRGEPVWFVELAPQAPEPDSDATPLFFAALRKFKKPPPAFYALVSPEPPAPRTNPGSYAEFESALDENRETLELLGRAVERPYFHLPIDYRTSQPLSILLEPVQQARDLSQLLAADVLQSIGSGANGRAVTAVLDGLGLAELMRDEPFLIVQLVRVAIANQAIDSLKVVVAHVELSPQQFAALDGQLELMESRFRLAPGVRSERAMLLTAMHSLAENAKDFDQFFGAGKPVGTVLSSSGLAPLRMRDEAFMLRLMSSYADVIDNPGPDGKAAIERLKGELGPSLQHILSRLLAPSVAQARDAGLKHRQRLIIARLGIRACRFRSEHGKFPDSLDELTDDKMPSVPVDLFAGRPLVYRVLPDGFVIYPVGDNGVDDGGGEQPDAQEHQCIFEVHLPSERDDATR